MEWKGTPAPGSMSLRTGITMSLAVLFAAAVLQAGCGKKEEAPVTAGPKAEKAAVASASACVSCHTDKEKLKMETAAIKKPPKSAMTSGKG